MLDRLRVGGRAARRGGGAGGGDATPPGFTLRGLDGRAVTSTALRGKIGVVHFWFTTCAGCLLELPEFQAFVDAHAGAPDVVITSVHSGGRAEEVAAWMREGGHRFEVLMDDGYSERAGVRSFPTTWFLDPEGRLRLVAEFGTSRHLREEFAWRIEALRERGRADEQVAKRGGAG
ncbi:MAG TPA: TlpA disulfide reductase family protein [Nannocystis sp.]